LAVRPSSEYKNLGLVGKRKQFSFSKTEFDLIYISYLFLQNIWPKHPFFVVNKSVSSDST
jgi:hypothetical protein